MKHLYRGQAKVVSRSIALSWEGRMSLREEEGGVPHSQQLGEAST